MFFSQGQCTASNEQTISTILIYQLNSFEAIFKIKHLNKCIRTQNYIYIYIMYIVCASVCIEMANIVSI